MSIGLVTGVDAKLLCPYNHTHRLSLYSAAVTFTLRKSQNPECHSHMRFLDYLRIAEACPPTFSLSGGSPKPGCVIPLLKEMVARKCNWYWPEGLRLRTLTLHPIATVLGS